MPKVAELYKEIYGWVGRGNQQLSYHNTEFRSVRNQNRVLDSLIEMYVLVNGHTLWRNSPNLMCNITRENMSQREFRFAVIRFWYAMFRKANGRMEVLLYPVSKQTHHRRCLAMTVTSPRKGTHNIQRTSSEDTSSKDQRLKCRICGKKTSFNAASVQALRTLWSFAVQTQVDSAGINSISLENMTYQVAIPRMKHRDYSLFYSLNNS